MASGDDPVAGQCITGLAFYQSTPILTTFQSQETTVVVSGTMVLLKILCRKSFNILSRASVISSFGLSVALGAPPDQHELEVLSFIPDIVEATNAMRMRLTCNCPEQQSAVIVWFRTPLPAGSQAISGNSHTDYPVSYCVSANLQHFVNLMLTVLVDILCEQGELTRIDEILSLSTTGTPPLHTALRLGHYPVAMHLIEAGAAFEVTDPNVPLVLDYVNRIEGQLRIDFIRALVVRGMNPNARDSDSSTLVHLAVITEDVSTVRFVVERGGSVTSADAFGRSPMHIAAALGYLRIVRYLHRLDSNRINASSRRNSHYTPLHEAAFAGHSMVVTYLLMQPGIDIEAVTTEGQSALHLAVIAGHIDIVAALLIFGADRTAIDDEGQTPVHNAVISQEMDVIRLLLFPPEAALLSLTVIDDFGRQPVHIAALTGNLRVVEWLLRILPESLNSGDSENDNFTPLHEAAFEQQNHVVEYLIRQPAINIEALTDGGQTPLHIAARNGAMICVTLLMNAGANVQAEDFFGRTPQALALEFGHFAVAGILGERLLSCVYECLQANEFQLIEPEVIELPDGMPQESKE